MALEPLSRILARIGTRTLDYLVDDDEPEPDPCPNCSGSGWVGRRVGLGHPDHGELFPCRCGLASVGSEEWEAVKAVRTEEALAETVRLQNFPDGPARTFDSFDVSVKGTASMVESARRFAAEEGPEVLVLVGQFGCGKTHIAQAVGRAYVEQGRSARYEIVARMLTKLRATQAPDSAYSLDDWLRWYEGRTVLILDDLGSKDAAETAWGREVVKEIIDHRLDSRSRLVITTNLSRPLMDRCMGERIASRLYENNPKLKTVEMVTVTAGDYRA